MHPRLVLEKTEKGLDEIRTRANRLPQQRRNVLIFVDGRFSVSELMARFANFGDLEATLQSLLDDGYIAPSGTASRSPAASLEQPGASVPRPVPVAAPVTATTAGTAGAGVKPVASNVNFAVPSEQLVEFRQEVRALSRWLYDTIGPAADQATAKLEAAIDREAFSLALQSCIRMIEATAGRKKAEAFDLRGGAIVERFLSG